MRRPRAEPPAGNTGRRGAHDRARWDHASPWHVRGRSGQPRMPGRRHRDVAMPGRRWRSPGGSRPAGCPRVRPQVAAGLAGWLQPAAPHTGRTGRARAAGPTRRSEDRWAPRHGHGRVGAGQRRVHRERREPHSREPPLKRPLARHRANRPTRGLAPERTDGHAFCLDDAADQPRLTADREGRGDSRALPRQSSVLTGHGVHPARHAGHGRPRRSS